MWKKLTGGSDYCGTRYIVDKLLIACFRCDIFLMDR